MSKDKIIVRQRKTIEVLELAIEFYANQSSWLLTESTFRDSERNIITNRTINHIDSQKHENDKFDSDVFFGGYKARLAQDECRKIRMDYYKSNIAALNE